MKDQSLEARYGAVLELAREVPSESLPALLGRLAEAEAIVRVRLTAPAVEAPAEEDRLVDMPEVAKVLAIPVEHARELGRRGEIPTVRVGERYVRVRLSSLRDWIRTSEGGRLRALGRR
jgi:excisionase family DNA binding protein